MLQENSQSALSMICSGILWGAAILEVAYHSRWGHHKSWSHGEASLQQVEIIYYV